MNFSESARQAIKIARTLAKENTHESFSAAHLLMGLLHNEVGLASELVSFGKDIHYLRDWADVRIELTPKASSPVEDISAHSSMSKSYEVGDLIRLKLGLDTIEPMCLFIALLRPNIGFTEDQLKTFPTSENEMLGLIIENDSLGIHQNNTDQNGSSNGISDSKGIANKSLAKYCKILTEEASSGKIDKIIGREGELRRIKEILGRRTKPNVIVVGEPGVGKSALIEGFALDIVEENVPDFIKGAVLYELDLGSLIAGASYKGEVEDRLKKIIAEIKNQDNAVLFIDEIHSLLDPNSGFGGAANMLKPELARGEITVIGATTHEEYRKYIEKEEAFSRRFDVLKVEEPDDTTAFYMLKNITPYYEKHHNLEVEEEAITESISLTKRYFRDRRLPDAAIDLIDQTLSALKMMNETTESVLVAAKEKLTELSTKDQVRISDYLWLYREIKNNLSPILLGQLDSDLADYDESDENIPLIHEQITGVLEEVGALFEKVVTSLTKSDIGAMVAQKTGIPLGKLQSDEKEKLLKLEEILNKRVVGQSHALNIVSEAIRESRAGLLKQGQPIGSFFFMGPTGTGKTELAKTMADFLFNDESALIRFDMSEFKEEHSVALLYGAPPGYVGYEEGGMLVNKIREKPYSIVLFDEIEKAHPSVFDLFLQILDEGKLSDRLGKEGDFSNAIILFTSNIGSQYIVDSYNAGDIPSATQLMETMSNHFRPEFLARLTEIVPFAPIQDEVVLLIFDIQLRKLQDILSLKEIELEVTDALKKKVALEDFDPRYGARPIKGKIRTHLRRPLARKIISGEVPTSSKVIADINKDGEVFFEVQKIEKLVTT